MKVTWVERVSPDILCVYNCCKYLLWHSVLMFCYFDVLCRILWYWRGVLMLRQDSKRETDWCMMSADFMNCDKQWSHGVLCYEQWSLHQRCMLRWSLVFVSCLVLWRCLANSVLASSSAGKCDVLQGLALLIYYIAQYFSSFSSWSILDDVFVVSALGFFSMV